MHPGLITVTISVTFTTLAGLMLTLRCVSRVIAARKLGLDDFSAIGAFVASVIFAIMIYMQNRHGLGEDIENLPEREVTKVSLYFWIGVLAYGAAMTSLKISACLQYLRFLIERWHRFLTWAVIVGSVLFGAAACFVNIFQCRPVPFSWDTTIPNGKCINILAWWYSAAAWTITTDIIVVAIPIIALKDLTLPRRQKIALMFVLALGGAGCIMSFLRLHTLSIGARSTNVTKDRAASLRWSSMEANIGIICISIPPMKALITAISPNLIGHSQDTLVNDREWINLDDLHLQAPAPTYQSNVAKKRVADPWEIP